jgi:hypothetical protein
MYLIHVGPEPIYFNLQNVGLITFRPNEPVEVKEEHSGKCILEALRKQGLVEVPVAIDKNGFKIPNMETALKNAHVALEDGAKSMFMNYVKTQLDDRISIGKPPLPPSPAIQKIIERYGFDLESYGIKAQGWQVGGQTKQLAVELAELKQKLQALAEQNEMLIKELIAKKAPKQ